MLNKGLREKSPYMFPIIIRDKQDLNNIYGKLNMDKQKSIYVYRHRELWLNMGIFITKTQKRINIFDYKLTHTEYGLINRCYLCHYTALIKGNCYNCPLDPIGSKPFDCLNGLFEKAYVETDWKKQARCCIEIARLPIVR